MSTPTLVYLQPNSLYVATQTIRVEGGSVERNAWHWSFFITDARGHAVQHHWNVGGVDQSGNVIPLTGTESYQRRAILQVSATTSASYYVVFTKMGVWVHPGADILHASLAALYRSYEGMHTYRLRNHPDGYRSCRTWIMAALLMFMGNMWLTPRTFASKVAAIQWLQTYVEAPIISASYTATNSLVHGDLKVFQTAMYEISPPSL